MNTEIDILDISSEDVFEEISKEIPLVAFRIVGCTVVTSLVGFTIIIFITSGMFHVDCLAQLCSETCIFAAYMLILLTTTEPLRINKAMCISIAVFLHLLFVGAHFFLLLEVLCMCQALLPVLNRNISLNTSRVMILGWVCPAVLTGISAIIWFNEYTTSTNCWLNYSKSPFYPSVIPIMSCSALSLSLVFLTLVVPDTPLMAFPDSHYKRAKCFRTTRLAASIITTMLSLSWFFGVRAYHTGQENMFAAFTVASILLGVCVLTLRISTDQEIREKITRNVLCLIVPSNRVTVIAKRNVKLKDDYDDTFLDAIKSGKGLYDGKIVYPENGHIAYGRNGKVTAIHK